MTSPINTCHIANVAYPNTSIIAGAYFECSGPGLHEKSICHLGTSSPYYKRRIIENLNLFKDREFLWVNDRKTLLDKSFFYFKLINHFSFICNSTARYINTIRSFIRSNVGKYTITKMQEGFIG